MDQVNPYQPPASDVSNIPSQDGVDESSPFSPKGRFGRLSYMAWSMLTGLIFTIIAFIAVGASLFSNPEALASPLLIVVQLIMMVPAFIFGIRRLHDFNASGWWILLMIVPIANFVLGLVMLFKPGIEGPNRFSPPRTTLAWEKGLSYIFIGLLVISLVLGIGAALFRA